MSETQHGVLCQRLERNSNKRKEISNSNRPTLFFRSGALLDERVHRYNEEATGYTKKGEQGQNGKVAQTGSRKNRRHQKNAGQAREDHAGLDFFAGSYSGEKAADPDAETEGGKQIAAVRFVHVQNVGGVQNDIEEEKRTEEPEEGVGDYGGPEDCVAADVADFMEKLSRDVPIEVAARISSGNLADAEAGEQSEDRQREKDQARPDLAAVKILRQEPAGERRENRGQKRAQLDDAIAPTQFGERKKLREKAVFCRAENRTLRTGEKQSHTGNFEAVRRQRIGHKKHHAELKEFRVKRDAAFAVLVGQEAAGDGEEQKRNREKQRHDEHEPEVARFFGEGRLQDQVADQPFEGVVAERALKLDGDEGPKAGQADTCRVRGEGRRRCSIER